MYLESYEIDPVRFLSAPRLAWQAALKKRKKNEFLADIDMLWMDEKEIKGQLFYSTNQYAKANDRFVKDYDKNNNYRILNISR